MLGDLGREEYVGRKRALELSLDASSTAPTYSEVVLVQAARLLRDLGKPWSRAIPEEWTEIPQTLFASMRVGDNEVVSASSPARRTWPSPPRPRRGFGWRARRDSNPRPSGPKPDALSAELRARGAVG